MACGLCVSGWITYILRTYFKWDWKDGYPVIFGVYAIIGLMKACLTLLLTERCEPNYDRQTELDIAEQEATAPLMRHGDRRSSYSKAHKATATMHRIGETVSTKLSPESRSILIRLCLLFAVNSFATGSK